MGTVLQEFQWAVQALAAPADDQLARFPDFVVKADELALDFDQWMMCAVEHHGADWSPNQRELIEALDRMLSSMSGSANGHLWQDEAVRADPQWEAVREAARKALDAFGWPSIVPPRSGSIYVPLNAARTE